MIKWKKQQNDLVGSRNYQEMNIIGPKIRELRVSMGLSQKDLAKKCSLHDLPITRSTLAKIESKNRKVSDSEVLRISIALNIAVGELFIWYIVQTTMLDNKEPYLQKCIIPKTISFNSWIRVTRKYSSDSMILYCLKSPHSQKLWNLKTLIVWYFSEYPQSHNTRSITYHGEKVW